MPKFLNTRKAVSELEDLIKQAKEKLILISPYLKLSKDLRELLEYRNKKDKITTIIFGKQELKPDEMKFFQSLQLVILKFNDNLHAKCYVNDSQMIITSLNLYEYSMANNKEMGILLNKEDAADKSTFEEALKEIEFLEQTSQRFEFGNTRKTKSSDKNLAATGFCIRTGVPIPFNIEKPFSYDAYLAWNEYGNPDYPERFCHFSGENSNGETSMHQPIMKKNWKKAKEIYDL